MNVEKPLFYDVPIPSQRRVLMWVVLFNRHSSGVSAGRINKLKETLQTLIKRIFFFK